MNPTEKQKNFNPLNICEGSDKNPAVEKDLQRIIQSATFQMKQRELRLAERYRKREQKKMVSVIMPTWNRQFIIKRAIDSVLAQSYQNFELIISDDGSTDGTSEFIRKEYGTVPQICYIYNKHRGVSHARNSALKKACGHLVAYLDSDNQWSANYLLVMVNALFDCPKKVTAYCGIRVINTMNQTRLTRLIEYDPASLMEGNYIDMNIFMHKRSLFEQLGGFEHGLEPLEDWELILRYTKQYPPLVVSCCLANYYIAENFNHQILNQDIDSSYQKIRALYNDE
jgi:glycosyltransferase involved in cell wall biosynthesis